MGTARPPLTTVAAIHNKRTRDGSRSKYSAMPPATPAHMRSRLLRISRRGCEGGGLDGGYGGGGVVEGGDGCGGGENSAPMHVPPGSGRTRAWSPLAPGVQYRLVFDETTAGRALLQHDHVTWCGVSSATCCGSRASK